MTITADSDLAALDTVTANLADLVASIEEHHGALATPCTDWNLTALVDHVTGGNWFTVTILAGDRAEDAMSVTLSQFGGKSATRTAAIGSLTDQLDAFHRPEVLDRTWNHVAGDLTGRQILRLRLHDLIVHSWDLEQTLRPGADLDGGLVQWGLDDLAREGSLAAEHFGLVDLASAGLARDGAAAYLRLFGR
jgi:uncharacterized protein (TIGR03086 family)